MTGGTVLGHPLTSINRWQRVPAGASASLIAVGRRHRTVAAMTKRPAPQPPLPAPQPAALLRPGRWLLTYAPRTRRPRWHLVLDVKHRTNIVDIMCAGANPDTDRISHSFHPSRDVISAPAQPKGRPDLVQLARRELSTAHPGINFVVRHVTMGIQVSWADGPSNSDVSQLLRPGFAGLYVGCDRYISPWRQAVWLLRNHPDPDISRLRSLASLPAPSAAQVDTVLSPTDHEIRMARTIIGMAGSDSFHKVKTAYAAVGYEILAAVAR
jgi:hypothetical protein